MFHNKTVSVVMPAFNEEDSIAAVIKDFLESEYPDEIIVVDNNSTDRTKELALAAGAKVVSESKQGYGHACRRALLEGSGDYIVLVESDETFSAKDLLKFLAYAEDFDLVQGTRTSKELIARSANMYFFLKFGNWFVAKILQVLYNGPALTDMGCTYRLVKREALEQIGSSLSVGGSAFLADMTTIALKKHIRMIEISVNYGGRKGKSKITGNFFRAVTVGLTMVGIILMNLFRKV